MARFTQNGGGGDGSALNYVQVIGAQQTISSAPNSIIDLTITTTGKPVQISVTGEGANSAPGSWVRMNLFRDGSPIGNEIQIEASAVSENVPYAINFIDEVPAGTYNYSTVITDKASGNWQFGEASGPVMNAVELTGFKGDQGPRGLQGIQGEQGPAGEGANLVVPTAIKDQNDADFITFTRTGTGTARIATPQDDLSLRSARDITLFAGNDGPGNVYIGWGDAVYTPDSPNRVATIGDITNLNTGDFNFSASTASTQNNMQFTVDGVPGHITLSAYNGVELQFNDNPSAGLKFPDGTIQTTAYTEQISSPLPDFLTYEEGRAALPHINTNFGWDSKGVWFGPTAVDGQSNPSYPVFTDFILNTTDKVFVSFNVDIEENCSDVGVCVFPNGTVPNWTWGADPTRIAAQFNCPSMEIHGTTVSTNGSPSVPAPGEYRIEFTYDPNLEIDNVKFEYFALNDNTAIGSMTLSQVLPVGSYRVGFAADNDIDDEGINTPLNRTYISQLSIMVNDGQATFFNTLKTGYSGASTSGNAPKTWTPNGATYTIQQAHGGVEVVLGQPSSDGDVVSALGKYTNATQVLVSVPEILSGLFGDVYNGVQYFRRLTLDINNQLRNFRIIGTGPEPYQWYLESLTGPVTMYNSQGFYANIEYGGAPALWWDADDLGFVSASDTWKFRGAKIEYHAYSTDSGTMIGTIYIASDSGDKNVTHIETNSGANDVGNVVLWNRYGNENELYAYRTDTEDDTIRIHWTAQVYYATEYYDN